MTSDDKLKEIFNKNEPLGPTHIKNKNRFVEELLVRDNLPFRRLFQNPTFLVGRKGSGKSSLLYSVYFEDESIDLELPSDDLFSQVIKIIASNTTEYSSVEQIESIWGFCFWVVICAHILDYYKAASLESRHLDVMQLYCDGLGINIDDPPFITIIKALNKLNDTDTQGLSFEQSARYSSFNNITRSDIELNICELLIEQQRTLRVIVDSLECYKLNFEGSFPAIAGFVRFVGQFYSYQSRILIHCALPAEVYFPIIEEIASNPAKDFSRCELVHWTAAELLNLAARRLAVFLRLHAPDIYERSIAGKVSLKKRKFSRAIWQQVLPELVTNGLGIIEKPEAYIIRHTQLSPRHVIQYMNEIVRLGMDEILNGNRVPEQAIVKAIRNVEGQLCEDVFAGWANNYDYENVDYHYHGYPHARVLCERLLPNLPHRFRHHEFVKRYKSTVADSIPYISSSGDALRLLAEIGVIGRVTHSIGRSNRYVNAEFEYALPSRLRFTKNSEFCLHPAFIGVFGSDENWPDPPFAIYPIGSDPDEPDYREQRG